jgi:hypothetical protein
MNKCNMQSDTFNGWPNRETWALHLHLTNDEALYRHILSLAADAGDIHALAEMIRNQVQEWRLDVRDGNPLPDTLRMLVDEVGSAWRVDWDAVARPFTEA